MGLPVRLSQRTTVSRWLVMPMAAMRAAGALFRALRMTSWVLFQMREASCSTQPGFGKICGNSS
jgi:hypothetical protein